jgi:hypothetical protein
MENIQVMSMRTNTSATLYNKYRFGNTDYYQRAVLSAVEWEARAAHQGTNDRAANSDTAIIFVPMTIDGYLNPRDWQALVSKSGWTLQVGDVLVKGTVGDVLQDVVKTLSELKNTYTDVLVISSVDTFDMGSLSMRHWEVGAKWA